MNSVVMLDMKFWILRQGKIFESEKYGEAGRAKSPIAPPGIIVQGRRMK